jgi:hypothetical protein
VFLFGGPYHTKHHLVKIRLRMKIGSLESIQTTDQSAVGNTCEEAVPHYIPRTQCLADNPEGQASFMGVPKPCVLEGCLAVCLPHLTMRGKMENGTIPRSSCKSAQEFQEAIKLYDALSGEPEETPASDTVGQVIGETIADTALATDLGISPEPAQNELHSAESIRNL